jgi:type IV secretion system protein VirD4
MSISSSRKPWGPSHQHLPPPGSHRKHWKAGAIAFVVITLELLGYRAAHPNGENVFTWTLHTVGAGVTALTIVFFLVRALIGGRLRLSLSRKESPAVRLSERIANSENPGEAVRAHSRELGGGAYLGVSPGGRWVTADPEHAVMLLGPPRSGKTTSVIIPSLLAAPGAALSTSTKRDVIDATWKARAGVGQVWLFDPCDEQTTWPRGMRKLCWSPVAAATSWDASLLMARAMTSISPAAHGTRNEQHWSERSAALLAPLLYAANLTNQPISQVLRWVLRGELDPAGKALEDNDAQVANDVLVGIARTDERERSSILSATAGILAAYNADATRKAATNPNFDPHHFAQSTDTVYITAPAHKQNLAAPLVVGLLEQIRHATYQHAQQHPSTPPVFFCLDEIANIAPIHDLPALASEAGGQHLHILACLQDLSQARTRWGHDAADGFLSLFQTKLILTGIADPTTLQAISTTLGEYDRHLVSHTISHSKPDEHFATHTDTENVTYHTQRQPTLSPGEIARLPPGHALILRGTHWQLLRLTPWHRAPVWTAVVNAILNDSPGPLA